MVKALVVFIIILAFVASTLFALRSRAKEDMPSQDVLERAKKRARALEEQEKSEE